MDKAAEIKAGLDYLAGLDRFGMKLTLDRIQALMELLGQPQQAFPVVHIAGTNGKGSTARFIAAVMQNAGLNVGLFTSPHLIRYNERIQINGEPISDAALSALINQVKPLVPQVTAEHGHPTEFEISTATAFLHFALEQVDLAIIEVGLGGMWDSTNVVQPVLSVITPVSMDHMSRLGDTLAEIAAQKAGIIKHETPVVCGPQQPVAAEVIAKAAKAANARVYWVKEADVTEHNWEDPDNGQVATLYPVTWNKQGGVFHLTGPLEQWNNIAISLLGKHQLVNAAVAATCCQILAELGFPVGETDVREAFVKTTWPGRFDVVSEHPMVILDGAHNVAGAQALRQSLQELFPHMRKVLVMGMLAEKQITEVLSVLLPCADQLVCTAPAGGRTAPVTAVELAALAKDIAQRQGLSCSIEWQNDAYAALQTAEQAAGPDGLVCVCGSLYLIGELLENPELRN
ncbi:MAG TPA: bifunctional folylpolyglutamate synthase/dihydrofolate synthase [Firmicutes bacterium]|nr:bifunctional folylpolyglutamate synthase/dihydrofolate synthase [Bacillota bacterium]